MGKFKIKRIIIASSAALIIGFLFIALRGPHVSNLLKKVILPELSAATGRQVMAQKIYINLFPLFIGAKDLKVFEDGIELLHIPKVKGYVGIEGVLKKEVVLKRLAVSSSDIRCSAGQIEDIIRKIKEYSEVERKTQVKVKVNAVTLNNGKFDLSFNNGSFAGSGVSIDAVMDKLFTEHKSVFVMPRINFTIKEISSKIKSMPELKAGIRGSLAIKKDILDVRDLQIGISGSKIDAQGEYHMKGGPDIEKSGRFNMRLNVLAETFKNIFNLKQSGDGFVSAKGELKLNAGDLLGSVADMELKGEFYIQTLMELLHVGEKVEGFLDLSGSVNGPLNDIKGKAEVRLRKGNLFSVNVDELLCSVSYGSGIFEFKDGKAFLYNGYGEAEATLDVIKSDRYAVHVKFSDVDSPAALDLIGWKPDIPFGKVRGEMKTAGNSFNPSGWFEYESRAEGRDVLGRIRKIKGAYVLRGDLLSLSDVEAKTNKSVFTARGDLDLSVSSILSLDLHVLTTDVTDMTLPFRDDFRGAGEFKGKVAGKFDDPVIGGDLHFSNASLDGYPLGIVSGNVRYKKELLQIKNLSASEKGHGFAALVSGSVRFPSAAELFDFKQPDYGLSVSLKNADLENAVKFVYKKRLEQYPKGILHADFTVNGPGPDPLYQGSMKASNVMVSKIKLDSAAFSFSYSQRDFIVKDAVFRKGSSAINAEGRLSQDDMFSLKVYEGRIYLSDMGISKAPSDAFFSLKAEGKGSIDDPLVEVEGIFHGGNLNGSSLGRGAIKAEVRDRNLRLAATFLDDRVTLNAEAYLKNNIPWKARLDVKSGRYDFLLTAFLKDVPEDLFVNMRGYANMSGNMNEFTADAVVSQVKATLYGHSFTNEKDIAFRVKNRKFYLDAVSMRSGGVAAFKVSGSIEIGREYDLVFEGSTALSPVKGFYKRIETIRGDGEFVFAVDGKWETPKVSGGVTISNAFFGLKDIPHRISSINGYLYVDEDKIVIQTLSGKVGGGDVNMSGVAYLKRFKMKSFFVDAVLNDISVNAAKDFPVNFNSNILYKGTPDAQTISGEVRINRARYKDRFEWKSRVFKAKQVEKPKGEIGALEKAALNVRIYGSDNITIDNNIARASLRVEMLLRGTLFQPVLLGRIESKAGDVYFRNNEFKILNASADFSDPLRMNPFMEIIAETSIKGYKIRLNLEGHTDQFLLTLVSDPPLDEIDILSLLTVGRLGKELKGIEGGIGAGEAASFLTGKVQDVLEERVRTLTGLDRLEVDPYVSKTTGNVTPRITVSKRLIGEKLFVTYSSAVGSTENNLLKIEYIFNKNISLIGVRDERGSVGSDIKFRFEFK